MSVLNKLLQYYKKPPANDQSPKPSQHGGHNEHLILKLDPVSSEDGLMKSETHCSNSPTMNLVSSFIENDTRGDCVDQDINSVPYEVIMFEDGDFLVEVPSSNQDDDNENDEMNNSDGYEIVRLKKPPPKQVPSKIHGLIVDCVCSLPDQSALVDFDLRGRQDPLEEEEWHSVISILLELIHFHFGENGETVIDNLAIADARQTLKDTYVWAGFVDRNFKPKESIFKMSQDGCYHLLLRRNRYKRRRRKDIESCKNKKMGITEETGARSASKYKTPTCNKKKMKTINYMNHCEKLSEIIPGDPLSHEVLEESRLHIDLFLQEMKSAQIGDYENPYISKVLSFVRHFQVYSSVVETTSKKKNIFRDFEQQCAMYLYCLKDMMKTVPPISRGQVKQLDIDKSPYMTLASIISLQLGKQPKFLLDVADMTEDCASSHGPVYIVQVDFGVYDLWVETVLMAASLTESQALFMFATISNVLNLKTDKTTNSYDLMQFLRKFLLQWTDFSIGQKQVTLLGRAFLHYSYRAMIQLTDFSHITIESGSKCARDAVM